MIRAQEQRVVLSQRQAVGILLHGFVVLLTLLFAALLVMGSPMPYLVQVAVAGILLGGLAIAYQRGWESARLGVVVVLTLLAAISLPTETQYMAAVVPPIVAFVLAGPAWLAGSASIVYMSLLVRSGFSGPYADISAVVCYLMIVGCLFISRAMLDAAQRAARVVEQHEAMQATTRAVAHQMNQPVTIALGYVQLLQMLPAEERDDADLQRVQQALERMAVLIRQFNELSRYQTVLYANELPMLDIESPNEENQRGLFS